LNQLAELRHHQGRLLGRMDALGFAFRQETALMTITNDVLKSSAIEGEVLDPDAVRSSVARRLGIEITGAVKVNREVEGVVEMMLDATQQCFQPLTKERLCGWQAALFPTGHSGMYRITVGDWRTLLAGPMQVVSGALGREKVHFEAPTADRIEFEMSQFLQWFEQDNQLDPVLKAGIAHLWFITIHPFEDGNGRIARAITDMALARADGSVSRFYSLSTQFEAEKKAYYVQLEAQQRHTSDITEWLSWFLGCLGRAILHSSTVLDRVLSKAKLWDRVNQYAINDRQRLIINRMLEDDFVGKMNTSKYAKLAKCSTDTALRDVQSLVQKSILIQSNSGGRSTSYQLVAP
jgi:Fic family protein